LELDRDVVRSRIREAFAGVRLGSGLSLRQAAAKDDFGDALTQLVFDQLPASEVTDDWQRIPPDELRRDRVAYLDAEGVRYYLPALLLWLLDNYDGDQRADEYASLTIIGTLQMLSPSREFRVHYHSIFASFTSQQRAAIALYITALPRLVALEREDLVLLERSMRDYWGRYLPTSST